MNIDIQLLGLNFAFVLMVFLNTLRQNFSLCDYNSCFVAETSIMSVIEICRQNWVPKKTGFVKKKKM